MGLVKTRRLMAMHKQERAKFGKGMVKRYCGKKKGVESGSDGKRLPCPTQNGIFPALEITLCNFNHVEEYLTSQNIENA